ncbi:MAG: hypothetical protein ACOCRX_03320 [Candidatus Woesearchaeota archaeon]
MKRKQFNITEKQEEFIREQAYKKKESEAEIVRRAIDLLMEKEKQSK